MNFKFFVKEAAFRALELKRTVFSGNVKSITDSLHLFLEMSTLLSSCSPEKVEEMMKRLDECCQRSKRWKDEIPHESEMSDSFKKYFFLKTDIMSVARYLWLHPKISEEVGHLIDNRLEKESSARKNHQNERDAKFFHPDVYMFFVVLNWKTNYIPKVDNKTMSFERYEALMERSLLLFLEEKKSVNDEKLPSSYAEFLKTSIRPIESRISAASLKEEFNIQSKKKPRSAL
jgi:hypothetical protein